MNDENTPLWIAPRSAIIVFRFKSITLAKFPNKRHTLISRTLHGLACAPRTSLTPGCPVENPAALGAATGIGLSIYCRDVPFISSCGLKSCGGRTAKDAQHLIVGGFVLCVIPLIPGLEVPTAVELDQLR